MFPQWTVPDLKEYTPWTTRHFRRVLSQVYVQVHEEYLKAQKKFPWRPFPPQSAINLNIIHLTTPSTSTLPPQTESHLSDDARIIKSNNSSTSSTPYQIEQYVNLLEHNELGDGCGDADSRVLPAVKQQAHIDDREQVPAETTVDITVDEAVSEHTRWVHTFGFFSSRPMNNLPTPQQQQFIRGSMALEPALGVECQRTFHLADIPSEEELVLERDSNDALRELSFVFVGNQGQETCIRCRWHIS